MKYCLIAFFILFYPNTLAFAQNSCTKAFATADKESTWDLIIFNRNSRKVLLKSTGFFRSDGKFVTHSSNIEKLGSLDNEIQLKKGDKTIKEENIEIVSFDKDIAIFKINNLKEQKK